MLTMAMSTPVPTQVSASSSFEAVSFKLIAQWEGKRNNAYLDTIAKPPIWTVCFGHTKTAKSGMYKTDAECKALLVAEIAHYRAKLRPYFSAETIRDRLPPKREAAYVSLAYNVGWYGAGRSTAVRRLNSGNIAGGCSAITWWNKAGGRVVRGLTRRRSEEYTLCMDGL